MEQGLTEQQAIELIKELEELGTDSAMIDEILHVVETGGRGTGTLSSTDGSVSRNALKMKLLEETDWRKKAALAALIISNDL